MEEELAIVYLTLLKREPNSTERDTYLPGLIQGSIRIDDVERRVMAGVEYKALQNRMHVAYDPSTHVMSVGVSAHDLTVPYDGVIVGNGKICMKTGRLPHEAEYSVISTSYDVKNLGVNNTNVIHAFKYNGFRFFEHDHKKVELYDVRQELNMYTAMFTTSYRAVRTHDGASVNVTHDTQALQQFPYCALQRLRLENAGASDMVLDLFHHVEPSGTNLTKVEYAANYISGSEFFTAQGRDERMGTTMVTSNMYLYGDGLEVSNDATIVFPGVYRIRVRVAAESSGTLNVVTGMMTEQDFTYPARELTRILLTIKDYNLRADHNQKWIDIWNTANIIITKRVDLEGEDEMRRATRSVTLAQRNVRCAMYNLFSVLREDVNVDMNVANLSAVDIDGEIFWNAEMFLVPVLIILRPRCARVLLEFRHQQMQFSMGVAAAFKNEGSQYVYKEDVANYKDMFWSPAKPATAFNTGLIGANVWNYYKATQDRYWLVTKGFVMLLNCTRFFMSLFKEDFTLKSVLSLSGYEEADNALSRYLGIQVIRNYIEACYELSISVPSDVGTLYEAIRGYVVHLERNVAKGVLLRHLPNEVTVTTDDRDELLFTDASTGTLIGSGFGEGLISETLFVNTEQTYTFRVKPGAYVRFYDRDGVELVEGLVGSDAIYSPSHGFTNGAVNILGARLASYKGLYVRSAQHGLNAFSHTDTITEVIHNVMTRPVLDSRRYLLETHLLLMHYYSRMLFSTINPIERGMMIKHNYKYHKKSVMTLEDVLVESNLDATLAQLMGESETKEYHIDRFEDAFHTMFHDDSTYVTRPWGNHNHNALLLFNMLTALLKIRAKGGITNKRFYSEMFEVTYDKGGFCMPRYWGSITLTRNGTVEVLNNDFFVHES